MVEGSIVPDSHDGDELVDLGQNRLVSMQTVQQIYHEITGQKEELSGTYRANHIAGLPELNQINNKIEQACEQYNVVGKNCSVTVYFVDDQKQVFSSFSRFSSIDTSSPSAIERILIKYDLLVVLPLVGTPQPYEIEIDISSRAAAIERRKQFEDDSALFFGFYLPATGSVSITYVDYVVARTFKQIVDDWFATLPSTSEGKVGTWLRKYYREFPLAFRALSLSIFFIACYLSFYANANVSDYSTKDLVKVGIYTLAGSNLVFIFADRLGFSAVSAAQKMQQISYLNVTRGDGQTFRKLKSSNKKNLIAVVLAATSTVALNVFSTWAAFSIGIGAAS